MFFSKNPRGSTGLEAAILITLLLGVGMGGYYLFYFQPRQVTKIDLKPTLTESAATKPVVNSPVVPEPTTKKAPTPSPVPKPIQQVNIGTAFRFTSFDVTVTSAKNLGTSFGSKYSVKKTEGQFVIVNFSAKNVGTNAVALSKLDFGSGSGTFVAQIQDSQGRNYESSNGLVPYGSDVRESIGYVGSLDNFTEIKPGFGTKFSLIYEVASDSRGMSVRVGNPKDVIAKIPLGF